MAVAGGIDEADLAVINLFLRESKTYGQVLARITRVGQVAAAGDAGEGVSQTLRTGFGIHYMQHGGGDGKRRCQITGAGSGTEDMGAKLVRSIGYGLITGFDLFSRCAIPVRIIIIGNDGEVDGLIGRSDGSTRTRTATRIAHLDLETVAGGFRAIMVVGKQAQIGVGDGLPIAHCHTVVLEYAVGWQTGDLHGVGASRIVRVGDGEITARTTNDRDVFAYQLDAGFAFDQHDVTTDAGRLVDRGDIYSHGLQCEQTAGTVIDRDLERVGRRAQYLAAVVVIAQVGDVADREGGADGQFVAVELEYALARQCGQLENNLRLGVVQVGQAKVDLRDRAAGRTSTRSEGGVAAFGNAQTSGPTGGWRHHRSIVFGGDGDAAGKNGSTSVGVVDDRERQRVAVTGLRSTRIGVAQRSQPVLHRCGIAGERGGAQRTFGDTGRYRKAVSTSSGNGDVVADHFRSVFSH